MPSLVRQVSRPVVRNAQADDAGGGPDPDETPERETLWSNDAVVLWSDGSVMWWSS